MKLLIRNLDRNTTEAQLRALFASHGMVQSCTVVMDTQSGQSKGFGFVEMPKAGEARVAMKQLNGSQIGECKVRVKKAETKAAAASGSVSSAKPKSPYPRHRD